MPNPEEDRQQDTNSAPPDVPGPPAAGDEIAALKVRLDKLEERVADLEGHKVATDAVQHGIDKATAELVDRETPES